MGKVCISVLFPPASGREEVGGPVQAARLGCEDHTALVQAAPQPGEAQHPGPLLRKHVSQRVQCTRKQVHFIFLRASPRLCFCISSFCAAFHSDCQSQIRLSLPQCCHLKKLILIRSSLAQPWPSSKRRPSGHRASTALFKLKLHACLLIFILDGNDW